MTIPHYGKREAGLLTAASPGDTLYFAFASYNDSGNIEPITGFEVGDIEVFKNGSATPRATDSGYSLISDTGQVGDRVGLYRFSVQLFNTADDASFYASGSWYQVAIDAVTKDDFTHRQWVGSFEIGRQKVNVVEIDSDTGAADVLQKFAATDGALNPAGELDSGSVANSSYLLANVTRLGGDTGAANWLETTFASGFSDTGVNSYLAKILADTDTGIQSGVTINAISDTGINERLTAIENKTNSLTFTVAGSVDANIQQINDVTVDGTGASGDEWGPA
jgi:hypothetical protein